MNMISVYAVNAVTGIMAANGIEGFFRNAKTTIERWGGAALMFIGVVMMIWAAVKTAKGLMGNSQRQQTSWGQIAVLFILGGALAVGGYTLLSQFSQMANQSINELAGTGGIIFPRF